LKGEWFTSSISRRAAEHAGHQTGTFLREVSFSGKVAPTAGESTKEFRYDVGKSNRWCADVVVEYRMGRHPIVDLEQ
jgi:hypothetical protein